MDTDPVGGRAVVGKTLRPIAAVVSAAWGVVERPLDDVARDRTRKRVLVVFAFVLGLSTADTSTVGASATQLKDALDINNTQIGLLVSVTSVVGALATLPFGVLADRVRRTRTLAIVIALWGCAMLWSAAVSDFRNLLLSRVLLGIVTAAAVPLIASLVGDYFPASRRGRVYGFILGGELLGAGFGFAVSGDVAILSWRLAFVVLAVPAFFLTWLVARLPEPERKGSSTAEDEEEEAAAQAGPDDGEPPTDAQEIARQERIEPDDELVLDDDPAAMNLIEAGRYVLRVRTNVVLIVAGALSYYFLAGVQTFGIEFVKDQYGIGQVAANALLLLVGGGALLGVLTGGAVGDRLMGRGYLNGRVLTAAVAAAAAAALFAPAVFTRSVTIAGLFLIGAVFALSAQNPPQDAARLDIMPPQLWGRAESIRTVLRSAAQALAPLVFGAVADYVFGGGRAGLQWTFGLMLLPLAASSALLFVALRTYPTDVAAAGATRRQLADDPPEAVPSQAPPPPCPTGGGGTDS